MIQCSRKKTQRGFTLLEMSIALAVAGLLFMGLFQLIATLNQQLQDQAIARQTRAIASAAVDYARSESQTIRALGPGVDIWQEIDFVDDGNPATPLPPLQPDYLPAGASQTNALGQTYRVFIHKDDQDRIESFVIATGGTTPLNDLRAARIAGLAGSDGGAIYSRDPSQIMGAYGGWSRAVSDFPPAVQALLGAGSLVTGSLFADNIVEAPFLYRDVFAGHPEYNEMSTNIDMNGNNLNEVNTIIGRDSAGTRNLEIRGERIRLQHPDYTPPSCAPGIPCGFSATLLDVIGTVSPVILDVSGTTTLKGGGGFSGLFKFGCNGNNAINCTNPTAQIEANGNITSQDISAQNLTTRGHITAEGNVQGNWITANGFNFPGKLTIMGIPGAVSVDTDTLLTKSIVTQGNVTTNGSTTIKGALRVEGTSPAFLNYFGNLHTTFAGPMEFIYDPGINPGVEVYGNFKGRKNGSFGLDVYARGVKLESDERLKKDIKPIFNALDKLLKINGVSYVWKKDNRKDIGVIAQNVQAVFPELVAKNPEGMLAVDYGKLIGPVIEAIRELKTENDKLKSENNKLQTDNKDLHEQMKRLEEKIDSLSLKEK